MSVERGIASLTLFGDRLFNIHSVIGSLISSMRRYASLHNDYNGFWVQGPSRVSRAYRLKKVWEYFRLWSYITVERPQHPWYPAHIVVTSKGERVPLGDFLTEQEKEELVSSLESIINDLR